MGRVGPNEGPNGGPCTYSLLPRRGRQRRYRPALFVGFPDGRARSAVVRWGRLLINRPYDGPGQSGRIQ